MSARRCLLRRVHAAERAGVPHLEAVGAIYPVYPEDDTQEADAAAPEQP